MNTQKIAAITGSRRGIGLAIAQTLAEKGWFVILSGTSPAEENEGLLAEFRAKGQACDYIPCRIQCAQERGAFIETILARCGRLDLLVNNAGTAPPMRLDILETTEENYDFVMNANCKGTFFLCQQAANAMLSLQKSLVDYHPRIVNISSISAYTASVNRGEYCISKAGISMITQLFAARLAADGIPVFEVRPGIIETDMTAGVKDKYLSLIDGGLTPVPRMGQPKDVADCVAAAASGALDFAVGQVLNADGGFHLRRL